MQTFLYIHFFLFFNNHQGPHHPKAHRLVVTESPLCSAEFLRPSSTKIPIYISNLHHKSFLI